MKNLAIFLCIGLLAIASAKTYSLKGNYQGNNFFSNFNFWSSGDPTHGYVNYVDSGSASSKGLIGVQNGVVMIKADAKNKASGRGRDSVRIETKSDIKSGQLIIADILHMPTGCGTWPALWLCGPNWPNGGEIDILEGVNTDSVNRVTLHTSQGCTLNPSFKDRMTGSYASTNCWVNAPGQAANSGCGISMGSGSYGAPFNSKQGGVYATLWTDKEISVYYWARAAIPGDIKSGSPNPSAWGKPSAQFQIGAGSQCPSNHFAPQKLIINLTFCGDWAGSAFGGSCGGKGSCNDYVRDHPEAFKEAYWAINSIKIYE